MGIYSFVQALILLETFGMVITSYANFTDGDVNLSIMYIGALLPIFCLIIFCFVLLFFSDKIANRLIPSNDPVIPFSDLNSKDFQSIAFSIIGVVIFLLALFKIVRYGSSILVAFQNVPDPSKLFNLPHIIGLIFQLFIGAALFFGAKPLSLFWHRFKYEWKSSRNKT